AQNLVSIGRRFYFCPPEFDSTGAASFADPAPVERQQRTRKAIVIVQPTIREDSRFFSVVECLSPSRLPAGFGSYHEKKKHLSNDSRPGDLMCRARFRDALEVGELCSFETSLTEN